MKVHFREQYGTKGREILYVTPAAISPEQPKILRVPLKGMQPLAAKEDSRIFHFLRGLLLPHGYPDSVSEDYIAYQKWDTLQALCSTINGTLTTHAILKGVGVGNDMVNPLSATVTWVLKDGTGHFGRIWFAWWKGSELDIDSKKWRLRADVLNDLAMGIEIFLMPLILDYSTYVLCATTTLKAIVGVAGGATRAALTQHHALRGNLGDVASKDHAQETCVNLLGSFIGLFVLTSIQNATAVYSIFFLTTLMHIFANIKAVKAVCLRTFNESRYLIALEEYFKTGKMLTPKEVNKLERVTIGKAVSVSLKVKIGLSVKNLTDYYSSSHDIESIISCFDAHEKFILAETQNFIGIYLNFEARPQDVLKAYFYAVSYLQDRHQIRDRYWEVQTKWNEFLNLCQTEGWQTSNHLLFVDEYRLDWRI